MKYLKVLLFILLITAFWKISTRQIFAIYDPSSVSNNRIGVHVIDTSNLSDIAKIINSNGGDWGYVTLVIQKGERDPKRWQDAMDEMRRLHLIPIVRVASAPIPGNNNVWEKPSVDEIDGWVSFLNSLNWVIKNRYVIIGNEPNHANEWGSEIDPAGYSSYLKIFSQKLKNANQDFFVMPAGFDASANNSTRLSASGGTMDETLYLEKMTESDPHVFDNIDGWASHSYPNPAFSGPGDGDGKGTVRSYIWELNYLKFLGVAKDLPVFITETGWTHGIDTLTTDIGPKIDVAFKTTWNDKRIVAITPFIYKYIAPPFDTFSWINKDGNQYDFVSNVQYLQKEKGVPVQIYKADIITGIFPKIATSNTIYHGVIFIKNTGQSIWTKDSITTKNLEITSAYPLNIEPGQIGVFLISGKYPDTSGNYNQNIEFIHDGEVFNKDFTFTTNLIGPIPSFDDIINYIKISVVRRIKSL